MMFSALILFVLLLQFKLVSATVNNANVECYETCHGFGEWLYGRGWLVPPYKTKEIGMCLKDHQTNEAEKTLISIYESVLESNIKVGSSNETNLAIARGLNAAVRGNNVTNSEGMYYCVYDEDTNEDSFYWVQNCNVILEGASGNQGLCGEITDVEASVGPIGYVVDAALTGTTDKEFIRYVFNETHAVKTEVQPIEGATGFSCSGRPWYQNAMTCENPAKVLCPTYFQGTDGLGTFQVFGDKSKGVVVAQDLPTWNLCQCVIDLPCDSPSAGNRYQISLLAFGCSIAISIIQMIP